MVSHQKMNNYSSQNKIDINSYFFNYTFSASFHTSSPRGDESEPAVLGCYWWRRDGPE